LATKLLSKVLNFTTIPSSPATDLQNADSHLLQGRPVLEHLGQLGFVEECFPFHEEFESMLFVFVWELVVVEGGQLEQQLMRAAQPAEVHVFWIVCGRIFEHVVYTCVGHFQVGIRHLHLECGRIKLTWVDGSELCLILLKPIVND